MSVEEKYKSNLRIYQNIVETTQNNEIDFYLRFIITYLDIIEYFNLNAENANIIHAFFQYCVEFIISYGDLIIYNYYNIILKAK